MHYMIYCKEFRAVLSDTPVGRGMHYMIYYCRVHGTYSMIYYMASEMYVVDILYGGRDVLYDILCGGRAVLLDILYGGRDVISQMLNEGKAALYDILYGGRDILYDMLNGGTDAQSDI